MIGRGEDGTGKAWEYKRGWMKRKANILTSKTFNESDWQYCNDCFTKRGNSASTNLESKTPYTTNSYGTSLPIFNESKGDTLVIENIVKAFTGYQYRAIASTPGFVCGDNDTTMCSNSNSCG